MKHFGQCTNSVEFKSNYGQCYCVILSNYKKPKYHGPTDSLTHSFIADSPKSNERIIKTLGS